MVAGQLRRVFRPKTSYFDNLVTPLEGLLKALDRGCHKPLSVDGFTIGRWEDSPSAVEIETGIHFHHEFKGGSHVAETTEDAIRRDILSVNDKFSYLSKRFLEVARSSEPKCYIRREYNGDSINLVRMLELDEMLRALGARNFKLVNAHQSDFYTGLITHGEIRYIQIPRGENDGWMGCDRAWNAAFLALGAEFGALR